MIYEAVEIIFNTKTKPRLQGLTVCVRIYNLCILAISTKLFQLYSTAKVLYNCHERLKL